MIPVIYVNIIDDPSHLPRFEKIYHKYYKKMFYTANQILNDPYEAEDALQDAFIGIARNMKTVIKIDDPKDLFYYLQTAAKNAALNRLPKKQVYSDAVPIHELWDLSNGSFWQELYDILDYEALVNIIADLPETYQEALYLHFVMELTIKETADMLQIKVSTAKQRLVRGKQYLIQKIREKGCFDHVID